MTRTTTTMHSNYINIKNRIVCLFILQLMSCQVGVPILLIDGSAFHQRLIFNVTIVIFLGFDMSNLVVCTDSFVALDGPPQHPPEVFDNERLPLPSGAPGTAVDAASCRHEHTRLLKRTLSVNRSSSVPSAPSERCRHNK
jgi:hypothetical protein